MVDVYVVVCVPVDEGGRLVEGPDGRVVRPYVDFDGSPFMFSDSEANVWREVEDEAGTAYDSEWVRDEDLESRAIYELGWLVEAGVRDGAVVDRLVDFVRTPEWSVSMLEDIADLVRAVRPDIGESFEDGDPRSWGRH